MEDMPALSRKMTMLRYMDVRLYAMVLCLILGLTAALSGFLLERAAAQNYEEELASPVLFDASEPERYSYVRLQYLTDSFVEHVKSRNRYYFGFDFMFRPYIISMKGELPENLKELMEYTYSDGLEEPPAPVDVCGFGEPIQSELMGYARESYSLMWEETQIPMTMEEMSDIVGNYYLDAVPRTFLEQYPLGLLFYVVPAVLLAGAAVCGILYGRRLKAQNRRLAGRLGELAQADREGRCVVLDMPRKPLVWGDDDQDTCLCPDCGKDLMGIPYGERMVLQCPECGQYLDATKAITRAEAEEALRGEQDG